MAGLSLASNYQTREEVNVSEKHASLLRNSGNYCRKKFFSTEAKFSMLLKKGFNKLECLYLSSLSNLVLCNTLFYWACLLVTKKIKCCEYGPKAWLTTQHLFFVIYVAHMIFQDPTIFLNSNKLKRQLVPKYSRAASLEDAPPLSFLDPVSSSDQSLLYSV